MKIKKILAGAMVCMMLISGSAVLAETIGADSETGAIQSAQSKLQTVNLLSVDQVNGIWADSTTIAVLRFQRFVNNVQGAGTLQETGTIDDATMQYLDFASGKGWNVGSEVPEDQVTLPMTPEEAAAKAEAEARAQEEEAARQAEVDESTIAYVQTMLRTLGLIEEVTGVYDEETKQAIIIAQKYINAENGEGTVPETGAFNDAETMIYLNSLSSAGKTIPKPTEVPAATAEPVAPEAGAAAEGETGESSVQPDATAVPETSKISDFAVAINGEQKTGTVELAPGTYTIAWRGTNVAMFSMYMYNADGQLLNKNENMAANYFNLDTTGMTPGAVYEIRIGAVPNGGQVADMEWRSLFLTLK